MMILEEGEAAEYRSRIFGSVTNERNICFRIRPL